MMVSPENYIKEHKDENFEQLIKTKNDLLGEISNLEKLVLSKDHDNPEWDVCPSPDVKYQISLEYLSKLCLCMMEKNKNRVFNEYMEN
ncbi:MAG: hypothetical protein MJ247_06355 [Alphaproteobacteria bacterium]|nr:hypothetical protein [Alphaproteobacteria bacterium]